MDGIRIVGWREQVTLPAWGIEGLIAKVDTGARSSAIHATRVDIQDTTVRFEVPLDRAGERTVSCEAALLGWRWVRDSGGHGTLRPVVATQVDLGEHVWTEEMTLADRADMAHRMLLGRKAVRGRFLVDPERSFLQSEAAMAAVPEAA